MKAPAYAGGREGAFIVNGLRSTYNNYLLDGVDNNAYGTSNQGFANQVAQPSPDAVAEFKVITNNYSAEYGRSGGATIDVAMRSGTNQLHGTVYEFLRNTNLNAVGYIFGARAATFKKPTLQQNQFGLTIGGPIVKNRVFFFGDYEGFRNLQRTNSFSSIPTLNDRLGILPVAVTNPQTGAIYPANTPIPANAITPFARQVLADLPAPNASTTRSSNFQVLALNRTYTDKFDAKVDGQINQTHERLPAHQPAQAQQLQPARHRRPVRRRRQRLHPRAQPAGHRGLYLDRQPDLDPRRPHRHQPHQRRKDSALHRRRQHARRSTASPACPLRKSPADSLRKRSPASPSSAARPPTRNSRIRSASTTR